MTASRSSDVRIGRPTGIFASLEDAAFVGEGVFGGESRALLIFAVGFLSFGGLRAFGVLGLVPVVMISDCAFGEMVGWGCCRLLANPVVVGLLGVLRAWG